MSQFIWLIVLLIIWIVPAILKANAKKKKAAEMNASRRVNNNATTQQPAFHQQKQSSSQEVEKMLEKLLGVEVTHEEAPIDYVEVSEINEPEYESIEFESDKSDFEFERAEKLSFEELIAQGNASDALKTENIYKSKKVVHPEILDFNLRKAVIYSEILKPKYF